MSIRAIALDLYRVQKKVADLEKELENATIAEKDDLSVELMYAKKEWAMIRKMLDGEKESGSFRKRFATHKRYK